MIDLTKLQAFLFAAESLSFSEAAKQLHLSQPTISHHIKSLELELGVELFARSGSGLKLTDAGRLLMSQAGKLLREAHAVEQMLESLQEKIAGQITIACSTTSGKYVLPQVAARFRQQHPGVKISILACTQENVVPRLMKEEADLGVVSYDACGGELECQEFFQDHIVLIVPLNHPWAERKYVEPAELLRTPFIMREPTSGTRKVMLAEFGKHDISLEDMDIFLEMGNAEAIVKTVEAGFGVSFVSRLSAAWALERGTVVEVPVAGFDLRRKLYMMRYKLRPPQRALEAFWNFVHDPQNADVLHLAES
jgi:LysR family transcriptional regulator, low CO2-responsive transcriptional regulator